MVTETAAVAPVYASRDAEPGDGDTEIQAGAATNEEFEEAVEIDDTPENEAKPQKPLDTRSEIAQNYEQRRKAEMEAQSEPPKDAGETDQQDAGKHEAAQEMVEIKVNGRTLSVEKDKVDKAGGVQAYQKQVAVADGFQAVAEQRKALELKEAELARREQALTQKDKPALPSPGEHQPSTRNDPPAQGDQSKQRSVLIKQHREALLDGDDETADSLMEQLLQLSIPQQSTGLDPDQLADEVSTRIEARTQARQAELSAQQALSEQHADWRELAQSTDYWQWVSTQSQGTQIDAESSDPAAVAAVLTKYKAANGMTAAEAEPQPRPRADTRSMDQKLADKRALNRPRAATGRAPAPPAPRPPSRSEVVQRMREQRGQV